MASVNNATGVYATLGYNFSDPNGDVVNLSANAIGHLTAQPAFISSWQAQDIASGSIGGYFQNPVSNYITTISTTASTISANIAAANCATLANVATICNTVVATCSSFTAHTNRLSGVTPFTGTDSTNPYYTTAVSYGKTALYITNQTDGITNTSPILGSFGSIFIGPQINNQSNTIYPYIALVGGSMTGNTTSLTTAQINQIISDMSNTNNLMANQQSADITFYGNLQTFTNNYNSVRQFSSLGETQTYLLNNFIGTPKLVTRLNS